MDTPPDAPYLVDKKTGDQYVLVASFVRHVQEQEPGMSKAEVIRRMEAVGWTRTYERVQNPDNPSESMGFDYFRVPRDWRRDAQRQVRTHHSRSRKRR